MSPEDQRAHSRGMIGQLRLSVFGKKRITKRGRSLHASQSGMTLIEVLMTLGIMSIVLVIAFDITNATGQVNRKTQVYSEANALAFGKMQDYANSSFYSIPVGDATNNFLVEDFAAEITTKSGDIIKNPDAKVFSKYFPGSRSLVEVRVVLQFDYGGNRRTIEYPNYIQLGGVGR